MEHFEKIEKLFSLDFWYDLAQSIIVKTLKIVPSIIFLTIFLIAALKLLRFFINKLNKFILYRTMKYTEKDEEEASKRINTLTGILAGIGRVVIWGTYVIMLLKHFGINIAPLIAGAGVVGLAVGFGAQELVRDFISGFFILLENQLRTGDMAIINGTTGLVEKLELRTITLRDYAGTMHVFQTGKINSLSNMTKEWSAAVFEIDVAYKEKTDDVVDVMEQLGKQMQEEEAFKDKIIEPMEIAGIERLDSSSVVIKGRFKTRPGEQWNVLREYMRRIKNRFDELGIEIPFPQTSVHFVPDEESQAFFKKNEGNK